MIYKNFAAVYDRLMQDIPYSGWVDYLHRLFQIHSITPVDILDIGCGTGNVTIPLAEMGYQVTGLDLSEEMLSVAESKARAKGLKIQWIQQDMTKLDLGGKTFDMVISMTDSLNYINSLNELKCVFEKVWTVLNAGGWFIFDLNSLYKIKEVFSNNIFTFLEDDVAYIWENDYDHKTKTCHMFLTFFVQEDDGRYRRFSEHHCETGYETREVCRLLENVRFIVKGVYAEGSFDKPVYDTERIYFAAQKG